MTTQGAPAALDLPGWAESLVEACRSCGEDADAAVKLAEHYGRLLPQPGDGQTARRWAVLAAAGEHNLTVARVLEAHSDALAILARPASRYRTAAGGCSPRRRHRTASRRATVTAALC